MRRASLHSRNADSRERCAGFVRRRLTAKKILEELPDLEPDDVKACMLYARRRIDHPVLAV